MRNMTKILAGTAIALAMSAASAQAAVFIAFDTGGGPVQVFTDADGAFFYNTTNVGGFENVAILGDTGAFPALLHTQQVNVNSSGTGGASLTVYVTHTDISGPMPEFGYISSFTSNTSRAGFSSTLTTLADAANGVYSGVVLSSASFSGAGAESMNNVFAGPLAPSAGLYSVTHKYVITDTGLTRGSTSPTVTLQAAVPEPGTWGLMIMGFGGAGAMLRARRRSAVAA